MSTPALNPLVTKIRTAHPGAYDDMDDAALTKAVLAKYPQYSDLAAPSPTNVPRPAPPSELAPPGFMERVGERIRQNVYAIPDMMSGGHPNWAQDLTQPGAKAEAQQDLNQRAAAARHLAGGDAAPILGSPTLGRVVAAETVGPRMLWDQAKEYWQHPENALGDIVTAAPELAEARLPGNKIFAAKEAPPPPPPSEYTQALDKVNEEAAATRDMTNQKFQDKAGGYHDKLSEAFDTAKREQLESQQDTQRQRQANVEARAAWEQKSAAAKASQEQAAKVDARRAEIEQAQPQLAEDIRTKAQAIRQAERAKLDTRWADMRMRVGTETPIPTQGIESATADAVKDELRGAPGSVKQFTQLMNELTGQNAEGPQEFTDAGQGTLGPKPGNTAPWQTVRTHSIAIGDALSNGNLPANIYRALKKVHAATEDALGAAPGAGEDYKALKTDERKFRSDFEDLGPIATGEGSPTARLVRAPNSAYASVQILGKAGDLLQKSLSKWDATGELAKSIQQMRDMAAEAKKLPKVKVIAEPPPFQPKSIEAATTVPERKPPSTPELESAPELGKPPMPPVSKAGPLLKGTMRVGGKMAGAGIGSLVGHPWLGMGAGGEAGSQLADRIAAARRPSPPPRATR